MEPVLAELDSFLMQSVTHIGDNRNRNMSFTSECIVDHKSKTNMGFANLHSRWVQRVSELTGSCLVVVSKS